MCIRDSFATAAFMSFDRLQEMTQANAHYMGATTQTQTAEEKANGPTYDLVWVTVKNVSDVQRIVKLIRDTCLNTYSLNDMLETVRTQSRQIQGLSLIHISWELRMKVVFLARKISHSNSMTSWPVRLSRFPVGSSASTMEGSVIMARAMLTRCC